MYRSKQVLQ